MYISLPTFISIHGPEPKTGAYLEELRCCDQPSTLNIQHPTLNTQHFVVNVVTWPNYIYNLELVEKNGQKNHLVFRNTCYSLNS